MMKRSLFSTVALALSLLLLAAVDASAQNDGPTNRYGNTLKRTPRPTTAAITEDDLKTRLYIYADDSLLGRQTGREATARATQYIANELRRLGLEPAGDNGTYFQGMPYFLRYYTSESQLTVGGRTLRFETDFVPIPGAGRPPMQQFTEAQVIYGGVDGDTTMQISAAQAAGRIVVLTSSPNGPTAMAAAERARLADSIAATQPVVTVTGVVDVAGQRTEITATGRGSSVADSAAAAVAASLGRGAGGRGGRGAGGGRGAAGGGGGRGGRGGGRGGVTSAARFAGALAIVTVDLEEMSPAARSAANTPTTASNSPASMPAAAGAILGAGPTTPVIRVSQQTAAALLGMSVDAVLPGAAGSTVNGRLVHVDKYVPEYGRNVVAIVRGSDPVLRDEYVAIGAHSDHTGYTSGLAVNHDSLKAYRNALTKLQIRGTDTLLQATVELTSQIKVNMDSINRLGPARLDSVRNGADDDGSGSMGTLEIAEFLALAAQKPKRSVIFVFHTGEEAGLLGSAFFAANPTVPREKIVAQLNMDMIGRGRAEDLPGGGPDYLAVVGANRLSTDLGKMVVSVNARQRRPLKLDYKFDEPTTWAGYNNIYGRSDHANYARYGIPIAFFFTGLHGDYHQLTDEPQYIDYPHYNRIVNYVRDLLVEVANAPTRPRVDRPGQE